MEIEFKGLSNKGGIYQIRNSLNGKVYVGSCKRFKKRAYDHRSYLRNNRHHNQELQRSYNLHKEENVFVFEILEVIEGDLEARLQVEQKYLNAFLDANMWEMCYNAKTNTKGGNGFEPNINKIPWNKGKTDVYSSETLEKISNSLKGSKNPRYKIPRTQEVKDKISKKNKGNGNGMYGVVGSNNSRSKPYAFISPTGDIFQGIGLSYFCKSMGLKQSNMQRLLSGKSKQHKGWRKIENVNTI